MSTYNPLSDNAIFLQHIGYLALIGSKGPFKNVNFNEAINGLKVIDIPADVIAGDLAFTATKQGRVVSNVLSGAKRTITVEYPEMFKPAGVPISEWDVPANRKQTVIYKISQTVATGENTPNITHNPWLVLATIGCTFARLLNQPPATNPEFALDGAAPVIHNLGSAVSLDFNVGGVSVQKKVAGTNSGSPVVADSSGVAVMPNGNTTGQVITYVVTKTGYNSKTFGPYTVVV